MAPRKPQARRNPASTRRVCAEREGAGKRVQPGRDHDRAYPHAEVFFGRFEISGNSLKKPKKTAAHRPQFPAYQKRPPSFLSNPPSFSGTFFEAPMTRLQDLPSPKPPANLSTGARREWRQLAPLAYAIGSLKATDLRAFGLLCEVLDTERTARLAISRDGLTIAAGSGGLKANPALKVAEVARNQATRLLGEFGLTPAARARANFDPPEGGEEDLAELDAALTPSRD